MADLPSESLPEILSDIFGERVSVDSIREVAHGEATVSLINMAYTRTDRDGDQSPTTTHVAQTAVVLLDSELDLPQFGLSPVASGWMTRLAAVFGDIGYIRFDDSPEFDQHYRLHGWNETPVRVLFTHEIRDHFARQRSWSVVGKRKCLVTFRHNTVLEPEQQDAFAHDSIEIMTRFQAGEAVLDAQPEIRRQITGSDVAATAERMTGVVGAMYRKQLEAISCTRQELSSFAATNPPRTIPPGIKRQVIGNYWPVIVAGVIFFLVGVLLGGGIFFLSDGAGVGLLFLLAFPVIGFLMVFLPVCHQRRKARLLRDGRLLEGKIVSVKRPSHELGGQAYSEVVYQYSVDEATLDTKEHVLGIMADHARSLLQDDLPVRVLVDPSESEHVRCLDLLVVFD